MIYLTGDTHGEFNRLSYKNFPDGKNLTKDDYVIILGDFGGIWNLQESAKEQRILSWLNDRNFTVLFIDGNHENFDRLISNEFKKVNMFNNEVKQISDSVFYLQRGHVYEINGKSFFVMGGATSIDKNSRVPGISWWSQEIPTTFEFEFGLDQLVRYDNKVDYILGHTTSLNYIENNIKPRWLLPDPVSEYFNVIEETVEFKRFYFGHWHMDKDDIKHRALYKDIILLGE